MRLILNNENPILLLKLLLLGEGRGDLSTFSLLLLDVVKVFDFGASLVVSFDLKKEQNELFRDTEADAGEGDRLSVACIDGLLRLD